MSYATWERDKDFMDRAQIAWPEDYELATSSPDACYGPEYTRRSAARRRMKLRQQGMRWDRQLAGELRRLENQANRTLAVVRSAQAIRKGAS